MFDFRDLFQWERFITPSIIKIFYWLAVGISALFGLSGIVSGLTLMALSPLGGLFWIIGSLIGTVIGVIFARIIRASARARGRSRARVLARYYEDAFRPSRFRIGRHCRA